MLAEPGRPTSTHTASTRGRDHGTACAHHSTRAVRDVTAPPITPGAGRSAGALEHLLPALRRLDHRLERAAAKAPIVFGAQAASDRYRGLYVSEADVERLVTRPPGAPTFGGDDHAPDGDDRTAARRHVAETFGIDGDGESVLGEGVAEEGSLGEGLSPDAPLSWLAASFDLTPFDLDVVVIALAPDLDLRYERLYGYLQDDVTRRRPTVDLALNLLCATAHDRILRRAHFAADAPLVRHRVLEVIAEPAVGSPPLLAHVLKLDEQIVNALLQQDVLDRRLAGICRRASAAPWLGAHPLGERALGASTMRALTTLVRDARDRDETLALRFHGPAGSGKRGTAAGLAAAEEVPLLTVDLARLVECAGSSAELDRLLALALREGWLRDALLYLHGGDALIGDDRAPLREIVAQAVAARGLVTILSSTRPWPLASAAGAVDVPFGAPSFAQRQLLWREVVTHAGGEATPACIDALASRFRLTPGQIVSSVAAAARSAEWRAAVSGHENGHENGHNNGHGDGAGPAAAVLREEDLFAGARRQSGHELAALATRIDPIHKWSDLVLPADSLTQLREIGERVARRHRVLEAWGFGARLSRGKGVNALFAGQSGTGKTMAAEIIAAELGLDLYRVELSGVVSKYIGETEKNLDRIFAAAESSNSIVLFDEADALFGKRSEVHDAHDRYANIEISYLLQKIEEYEGVAILSTNLRGNLDAAFVRRLAFTVHFPFPDAGSRRRIWTSVWPARTPLADDVDIEFLAQQFALSGGNIKNIALAAAFLAAEHDGRVSMRHLIAATRREYQKLGKELSASEAGAYAEYLRA
jgi:AAA+ superfamily predicted ATPase